jgi:hypothetical protein
MQKYLIITLLAVGLTVPVGIFYAASNHQDARNECKSCTGQPGTITGLVLDADGQPLSGAEVFAVKSDSTMGKLPFTSTDEQGRFQLKNLSDGTYTVHASKEKDGYADTAFPFYSVNSPIVPQVNVNEQQETPEVTIRFKQKAPKLFGRVVDAVTGMAINNSQITLRWADNPEVYRLTGPNRPEMKGRFEVLVPPISLTIEVQAPGYKNWTYSDDGSDKHAAALKLEREETKELTVVLQPVR